MQIPMEIMSLMMIRTDSGSGVRQRAGTSVQNGSDFGKIIEKAFEETQPDITDKKPDTDAAGKETKPAEPQKPDNNSNIVWTNTGAMGIQNEVTFILEGDMEFATTPDPEMRVEPQTANDAVRAEQPAINDQEMPGPVKADTKEEPVRVPAATANTAENADTSRVQNTNGHANNAGAASVEPARMETAKEAATNSGGAAGEVTARTPEIRTTERQGKEESSSEFSNNGDLGPLENENDNTHSKGQKVKTFSDTVAAVRNAAEGAQETVNTTTIPLAEGIRPNDSRRISK